MRERDQLFTAMEQARRQGIPAPCEQDPNDWTHDFYNDWELIQLKWLCMDCPVLAECAAYVRVDRDRLWGVVAGIDLTVTKKNRKLAMAGGT